MRNAMHDYKAKVRAKEQGSDATKRGNAVGGVLVGQKGVEMMREKAEGNMGHDSGGGGVARGRLV